MDRLNSPAAKCLVEDNRYRRNRIIDCLTPAMIIYPGCNFSKMCIFYTLFQWYPTIHSSTEFIRELHSKAVRKVCNFSMKMHRKHLLPGFLPRWDCDIFTHGNVQGAEISTNTIRVLLKVRIKSWNSIRFLNNQDWNFHMLFIVHNTWKLLNRTSVYIFDPAVNIVQQSGLFPTVFLFGTFVTVRSTTVWQYHQQPDQNESNNTQQISKLFACLQYIQQG